MFKNLLIAALIIMGVFLYTNPKNTSESSSESDSKNIIESMEKKADENGPSLDISGQGIQKLPSYVLSKTNLEVLDISDNSLTGALPSEIGKLRNLRVLKAGNNDMTGDPTEVGQLQKLEILDLSNNQLTGLPNELGNLKNLKTLNLSGNDYAEQDLEAIKQGLSPNIEIIL